ncbi:MAG: septation protein IspZ [Bdellovibrionaceae bacterium]|nr:septation protein IspZ [Pseudobdellovibrionaceae bacterium]
MEKIKGIALFFYKNFGPLIVFYVANHFWGLKTAIAVSLVFTVAEIIHYKISKKEITTFFKFSVALTFVFGVLDLTLENAFFYKIEATVTNLFTAFFFGITLFQPKPLIQQFAEQQGRTLKEQSIDKTFFFRLLTMVWTFYFILKAILYLWINLNSDLEQGLIVRTIIGNVSFGIMLFVSIGLARPIWNLLVKLKVMPSARSQNKNIGLGEIKVADWKSEL